MKKNAKLASLQTSLRHVAIFLHNANFLYLRVTNSSPNSPVERCCVALETGCDSFFVQRMLSVSKVGQVGSFSDKMKIENCWKTVSGRAAERDFWIVS